MIELSRSLNFRVVAEQVEDQLSLDTVKRHGHRFRAGLHGRPPAALVDDARELKTRLPEITVSAYNPPAGAHNKLLWHFSRA